MLFTSLDSDEDANDTNISNHLDVHCWISEEECKNG
jgi:hypothetical protein